MTPLLTAAANVFRRRPTNLASSYLMKRLKLLAFARPLAIAAAIACFPVVASTQQSRSTLSESDRARLQALIAKPFKPVLDEQGLPWDQIRTDAQDKIAFAKLFLGASFKDCSRIPAVKPALCRETQRFLLIMSGNLLWAKNGRPVQPYSVSSDFAELALYAQKYRTQFDFLDNQVASVSSCLGSLCARVMEFPKGLNLRWARQWRSSGNFFLCALETRRATLYRTERADLANIYNFYRELISTRLAEDGIFRPCDQNVDIELYEFAMWRTPATRDEF